MDARLESWLKQTVAIEVAHDPPNNTPGMNVPAYPWRVSVTNGEGGHNAASSLVARCSDELHAELVAAGLQALKDRI